MLDEGFVVYSVSADRATSEGSFLVLTPIRKQEAAYAEAHTEDNYCELMVLRNVKPAVYELVAQSRKALAPYGWDEYDRYVCLRKRVGRRLITKESFGSVSLADFDSQKRPGSPQQ